MIKIEKSMDFNKKGIKGNIKVTQFGDIRDKEITILVDMSTYNNLLITSMERLETLIDFLNEAKEAGKVLLKEEWK